MALIVCPECGKRVSDRATICPECGYPIDEYVEELEERRIEQDRLREEQEQIEKLEKRRNSNEYKQLSEETRVTIGNQIMVITGNDKVNVLINRLYEIARDKTHIVKDGTLFHSCKKGFAVCKTGIYFRDDKGKGAISWDDFMNYAPREVSTFVKQFNACCENQLDKLLRRVNMEMKIGGVNLREELVDESLPIVDNIQKYGFCVYCGKKIQKTIKFCNYCGKKIER